MNSLKKLLKRRKYNLKNRFYVEASYLNNTVFKEGVGLSYNINNNTKELTIVATKKSTKNHVSAVTQSRNKKVVPTIDIRKSDVREFLNSASEFELSVYEDKIILSVIANEKEQIKEELLKDENNNVVELSSYKNSKMKYFAINTKDINIAVGEQLSFDSLFNSNTNDFFNPTKMNKKIIRTISLFSGCGMLDKGFLDNGNYDIKFAIDMFEKKRLRRYHLDTYRHNIGDHIVEGDVLELTKEDIPQADFVLGGIPCVKFSKLNTKDNFRNNDKNTFPLLEQFLNVVEWSKSKIFLIENVKEFLTVKNGAMIKRIKERLSDFNIAYRVINSANLGSAQSRERAFILGIKGNIIPSLELPSIVPVKLVRDAFKGVESTPQHNIRLELKGNYLEMAKYIPQGGNGKDVPEHLRPNRKFDNFIQRLHMDKHSPTLTGIDSDYLLHPLEDRKPSVAECRRIQGLPDDFLFIGSATSIFTQLKNGVDYHVSSFLAKTIYEQVAPIL